MHIYFSKVKYITITPTAKVFLFFVRNKSVKQEL